MLHRAVYGSLERFLGHAAGARGEALPPWLAPVQVRVAPITAAQLGAAALALAELQAAGLRAELVGAEQTLARRVAEAHADGVPCLALVGNREAQAGTLALRERGEQRVLPRAEAIAGLVARCAPPG
jgi:threonyl-tRNA synthetase